MKTRNQIYETVKKAIESKFTTKQLRDILIEVIDNYEQNIVSDIYVNHVQRTKLDD